MGGGGGGGGSSENVGIIHMAGVNVLVEIVGMLFVLQINSGALLDACVTPVNARWPIYSAFIG